VIVQRSANIRAANIQAAELNQDLMNEIAKHASYKKCLAAFRQTSKHHNQLVENTAAGKLAREASKLEPSWLRKSLDSLINSLRKNKDGQEQFCFISGLVGATISFVFVNQLNASLTPSVLSFSQKITALASGFAGGMSGAYCLTSKKLRKDDCPANYCDDMSSLLSCYLDNGLFAREFCASAFVSAGFGLAAGIATSIVSAATKVVFGFPPHFLPPSLSGDVKVSPSFIIDKYVAAVLEPSYVAATVWGCAAMIANMGILANNGYVNNYARRNKIDNIHKKLEQPYVKANNI
jgi:hypothetical protein